MEEGAHEQEERRAAEDFRRQLQERSLGGVLSLAKASCCGGSIRTLNCWSRLHTRVGALRLALDLRQSNSKRSWQRFPL